MATAKVVPATLATAAPSHLAEEVITPQPIVKSASASATTSKKDSFVPLHKSSPPSAGHSTASKGGNPTQPRSTSDTAAASNGEKQGGGSQQQSSPQGSAQPGQANATWQSSQLKKVSRRSSKPIINWFQRKLASTGRARRASDSAGAPGPRPPIPPFDVGLINGHVPAQTAPNTLRRDRSKSATSPRPKSTPGPIETGKSGAAKLRKDSRPPPVPPLNLTPPAQAPNAISLNGDSATGTDDSDEDGPHVDGGQTSRLRWSLAPESAGWEADEDASVRPLPGSAPPSPTASHSSSSYLSGSRTFRSMAASTKPTTVMSVDLGGGGMAHIAEPPPTPLSHLGRFPHQAHHARNSSGGISGVAFALNNQSRDSSPNSAAADNSQMQAPLHTTHHPRDNPRPSSPPPDDASVLTLASSAFGVPGARIGANAMSWAGGAGTSTVDINTDTASTSHYHYPGAGDNGSFGMNGGAEDERDVSASMRALRPRRSWESEASRWSARIGGPGGATSTAHSIGPSTPAGERSLWATSIKTGGHTSADGECEDDEDEADTDATSRKSISITVQSGAPPSASTIDGTTPISPSSPRATSPLARTSIESKQPTMNEQRKLFNGAIVSGSITPSMETPGRTAYFTPAGVSESGEYFGDDARSVATSTAQTDAFDTAPSTPVRGMTPAPL